MFNRTISDSIYRKYMPLYHRASRQFYAIPLTVYDDMRKKYGGQELNYENPDLLLECYLINIQGDNIIEHSKIELPVKELQAIGNSEKGPTLTNL